MATAHTEPGTLTRADIERRAAEVLRTNGVGPVRADLITLTERLGVAVRSAKFRDSNLVGAVAKRGADVTVLVAAVAPPARKRFALAHELGHFFLHLSEDGEFMDREVDLFRTAADRGDDAHEYRLEAEANAFAVGLLMPEPAVRAEWQRLGSLGAMARRFNVSRQVMGRRVAELGLA